MLLFIFYFAFISSFLCCFAFNFLTNFENILIVLMWTTRLTYLITLCYHFYMISFLGQLILLSNKGELNIGRDWKKVVWISHSNSYQDFLLYILANYQTIESLIVSNYNMLTYKQKIKKFIKFLFFYFFKNKIYLSDSVK